MDRLRTTVSDKLHVYISNSSYILTSNVLSCDLIHVQVCSQYVKGNTLCQILYLFDSLEVRVSDTNNLQMKLIRL